jgi:hypothetical protein
MHISDSTDARRLQCPANRLNGRDLRTTRVTPR